MDYTKFPQSRPQDTPFGSGIHYKASRENDVRDNVMAGIGVGRETCIRDKDMDPTYLIMGDYKLCVLFEEGLPKNT